MKSYIITKKIAVGFLTLMGLLAFSPAHAGGSTTEFNVDGLKVILKQTPKDVISVTLIVEGGTTNYSKEKEGIEDMAFEYALTGGTTTLDATAFGAASAKLGTRIGSSTTYDFGNMNMSCVKMFWDESWNLFADAIMHPAFDEDEFNLLSEQMVSAAQERIADPDEHLRNIAMQSSFGSSSYASIPSGTPESLAALTQDEVVSYYNNLIGKKRVFLVVAGNIEEKDLRAKVEASLAMLPDGQPAEYEERTLITEASSYIEDRDIATNYIRGLMSAPTMDTQDGVTMRVAMSILRDRFFLELRTKRSLTYAPGAFYATGVLKNTYNGLYVSTLDPKQSMEVMVAELDKIKSEGFTAKELVNEKQTFLTHYFMGQERSGAQAFALGMAEISGGWEMADQLTEHVNKITLEDLNRVFDEYSKTISWTYLGKADAVSPEDFKQPKNELEIQMLKD